MGMCNYCIIEELKKEAALQSSKVTLIDGKPLYPGAGQSKDVYVCPVEWNITKKNVLENKRYWVMTVARLSKHCAC